MEMLINNLWLQLGALGLLIGFLVLAVIWLAKHNKCMMKEHLKMMREDITFNTKWKGEDS